MQNAIIKFIDRKITNFYLQKSISICILMLLATAFYLYQIGAESLWMDEIFSVHDAQNLRIWWQSSRPLYFHLLKVWMSIDTSDSWLRGLSVFFGVGSIFLIYQLGRLVAGESVGLISALMLTLSPLFINHVQEVRMYSLSTCISLGGTLALVYAFKYPSHLWIALWSGLRYLAIMATPLNAALLLPDLILIIHRFGKQSKILLKFIPWFLLLSLLLLPNAMEVIFNSGAQFMGIKDEAGVLKSNTFSTNFNLSTQEIIKRLFYLPTKFTAWPFTRPVSNTIFWFYNIYTVILISLLWVSLVQIKRLPKLGYLAVWAFFPLSSIVLVSRISRSLFLNRYLLFICPYILILLSASLIWIANRARIKAIIVTILYAIAVGGGLARYYTHLDHNDWRGVGKLIDANEQVGDEIAFVASCYFRPPHARPKVVPSYYHKGSAPIHVINRPCNNDEQIAATFLQNLPPIKSRLWIIYWSGSKKQYRKFQEEIQQEFAIQKQHEFKKNLRVMLVTKNSAMLDK